MAELNETDAGRYLEGYGVDCTSDHRPYSEILATMVGANVIPPPNASEYDPSSVPVEYKINY